MPKHKGNSEDWLDSDHSSHTGRERIRPKKKQIARSANLPLNEANATVAEVFPNQCRVILDGVGSNLNCSYKRAEVIGKSPTEARERTPVAVGDRVQVTSTGNTSGVIEGICNRKNCLSRPAPGRNAEKFHHVLAANIDLLVIVASTQDPEFSPGLVDRFLVAAEAEKIPAMICLTKTDLKSSSEATPEIYIELGYRVIEISSPQKTGFEALAQEIKGKTVVFCGQSGVGKTSLLRILLGQNIGKVGSISAATGKGKHTTTGAVLIGGTSDSRYIDTPGIKEFGLSKISPELLREFFPEFKNISCPISNCLHDREPDCSAQNLPRHPSYLRILKSLVAGEN